MIHDSLININSLFYPGLLTESQGNSNCDVIDGLDTFVADCRGLSELSGSLGKFSVKRGACTLYKGAQNWLHVSVYDIQNIHCDKNM